MKTPKPCANCGAPCHSTKLLPECAECARRRLAGDFWSPPILEGGRWVMGPRRVLVWQPDPQLRHRAPWGGARCGTNGGYYRHLRRTNTEPCDACRAAHTRYELSRQQRARKAVA